MSFPITNGHGSPEPAPHVIAQRLDTLVQEFENHPLPEVRERVFDLLQTVDALHRPALEHLIGLLQTQAPRALERALTDPAIRMLLALYELAPDEVEAGEEPSRTAAAFIRPEQIRPAKRAARSGPRFEDAARLEDVPPGAVQSVEIGKNRFLLANIDGTIHALIDRCPRSVVPLSLGSYSPPIIVCSWHNEAFDVRTGHRSDGQPGPSAETALVEVADGMIRVAKRARPALPLNRRP